MVAIWVNREALFNEVLSRAKETFFKDGKSRVGNIGNFTMHCQPIEHRQWLKMTFPWALGADWDENKALPLHEKDIYFILFLKAT